MSGFVRLLKIKPQCKLFGQYLHHPVWQTMEVYGLALTPQVQQALEEYGVTEFSHTSGGFLATRLVGVEK